MLFLVTDLPETILSIRVKLENCLELLSVNLSEGLDGVDTGFCVGPLHQMRVLSCVVRKYNNMSVSLLTGAGLG